MKAPIRTVVGEYMVKFEKLSCGHVIRCGRVYGHPDARKISHPERRSCKKCLARIKNQ